MRLAAGLVQVLLGRQPHPTAKIVDEMGLIVVPRRQESVTHVGLGIEHQGADGLLEPAQSLDFAGGVASKALATSLQLTVPQSELLTQAVDRQSCPLPIEQ